MLSFPFLQKFPQNLMRVGWKIFAQPENYNKKIIIPTFLPFPPRF
jgi:hypothetical protein